MAVNISYAFLMAVITLAWVAVRAHYSVKQGRVNLKREFQLVFDVSRIPIAEHPLEGYRRRCGLLAAH